MFTSVKSGRACAMGGIRTTTLGFRHSYFAAFLVVFFGLSIAVAAAETVKTAFNIEAKPARQSLTDYARQAQVQLGYADDVVDDVLTNPVIGEYDNARALELLLKDTGLEAEHGERGIFIRRVQAGQVSSGVEEPSRPIAVTNSSQLTQAMAQAATSTPTASAVSDNRTDVEDPPASIEEIVVTGTHIRGVENVGATMIAFTREEISKTGYSTVEEVFESLPQNLDEISADGAFAGASRVARGNVEGASGISLRGLGPGSTLVLINGKRRPGTIRGQAVDVSAIPLSMVERVEIVTGGASAIYGSDAVAGVVNVVTVTELDGAETQVYYGESSAGGERFTFSQTFGRSFQRGGFVLGYDYSEDEELDVTATGVVQAPSPGGILPTPGLFHMRFPSEQHVGLFAGHYEMSDRLELYADAQFSSSKADTTAIFTLAGCCDIGTVGVTDSDQYSATGGVRIDVGENWQIDSSALHGVVDTTRPFANLFDDEGSITTRDAPLTQQDQDEATLTSFSVIADGPVGVIGEGTISSAIGIEFRQESYERQRYTIPDFTPVPRQDEDRDRDIWSIFGEVHLPLIDRDGQRLEVSFAGRYEDYSDFGDTFNPQVGAEWEPIGGLTLRGSYAQAFRAPDLFTLDFAVQARVRTLDDPANPGTAASMFVITGGNPDLQPEEADTYTLGVDWEPSDRTKLSLSYFNIEYEGRIDQPGTTGGTEALEDEILFPGLINRNPTPMELGAFLSVSERFLNNTGIAWDPATDDPFATFSNIMIFDNRRNNVALEEVDGLDFQATTVLEAGSGDWSFGLNGTYYLDFTQNITVTSPTIDQLNQPAKTVDLRLRGQAGWSRSAWNIDAAVNYVAGYDDTLAATPTGIDSWTTVDLTVRYDAGENGNSAFLDGFKVALSVDNVFGEDPPVYLSNTLGLGYDPANADPLGRFVSLRLSKSW